MPRQCVALTMYILPILLKTSYLLAKNPHLCLLLANVPNQPRIRSQRSRIGDSSAQPLKQSVTRFRRAETSSDHPASVRSKRQKQHFSSDFSSEIPPLLRSAKPATHMYLPLQSCLRRSPEPITQLQLLKCPVRPTPCLLCV